VLPALLGGLLAVRGLAAIPPAAAADPRYALGYLVVTHYPGVNADGTGDSRAGIQEAMDDAYTHDLVLLFPLGTYVISDSLRCFQWWNWNARGDFQGGGPYSGKAYALLGSAVGGARPVIKLAATPAANFDNPAAVRPLWVARLFKQSAAGAVAGAQPAHPLAAPANYAINSASLFNVELRNIDFDCGGHAGAVGLALPAAQGAFCVDVRINATGAYAGFYGLPGRHAGAVNVQVDGGQYGIVTGTATGATAAGSLIVGARLYQQTVAALRYEDFVPLVLCGFHIVKAAPPVLTVVSQAGTAWNTMCLLDGRVELGGASATPVFDNAAAQSLYLRNVYVTGADALVLSGAEPAVSAGGGWKRIEEYSYTDQSVTGGPTAQVFTTRSLIDGVSSRLPERVRAVTADLGAAEVPADLVERHLPPGGFPSYEGSGSPATIVVTEAPYRATPNDGTDDRAAIQAAIDAASAAGHGRVFLPKGAFSLGDTLHLRANTVLFGASKLGCTLQTIAAWLPTTLTSIVQTDDDPNATTYLGSCQIASAANLYEYPFNFYHWRAGGRSMTFGLELTSPWKQRPAVAPHHFVRMKYSASGGGRHYFAPQQDSPTGTFIASNATNGYRTVLITGTTQPLWFYGSNFEGGRDDERATDAEVSDAANVRLLGFKREGRAPMLVVNNSRNLALYGAGAMRDGAEDEGGAPAPGKGFVEVRGTSHDLLMANLLVQTANVSRATGATLREAITGWPVAAINYPEGVALYKRGAIDDRLMRSTAPAGLAGSSRLVNLSTRAYVPPGGAVALGFYVRGPSAQPLLIRAVGPGLGQFGVSGALAEARLEVGPAGAATLLAANRGWGGGTELRDAFARVGAFPLAADSRDSAVQTRLAAGGYVARLTPGDGAASGIALVELYDSAAPAAVASAQLVNVSTLGFVGPDDRVLTAGFTITGGAARRCLLRAVGPGLAALGVAGFLADPQIELRALGGSAPLAANDDWSDLASVRAAMTGVGAFALAPGSKDAVLVVSLLPGGYTAVVSSVRAATTGQALIEIYDLEP
jgi:hypothetical protein